MAWPATNWYLPGGEGMVVNRAGTVYAVSDADECCCETTVSTTTVATTTTTEYQEDCPSAGDCLSCLDGSGHIYAIIGTPGDPTTCQGFPYAGPYVFNPSGILDCYWNATIPQPPIVSDTLVIACVSGADWPDNLARWVMHLTVTVGGVHRVCYWNRLVTGPSDCPNGLYTSYGPLPPPIGAGCAECADWPNVVVYT